MTPTRTRAAWFVAIVLAAVGLVVGSLSRARQTSATSRSGAASGATYGLAAPPPSPYVLVQQFGTADGADRVALAPLESPDGRRFVTPLTCVRVHAATSRGLCLTSTGTSGQALVFDDRFEVRHTLALTGPPSRARVSRDGRLGAVTVFESGHSYAEQGFSTRTTILDLERGALVADLESFAVWQGETRVTRIDVNFWGVTFVPDSRRFYATLAFGGTPYLVEGDLDRREVRVVAAHVECPSLSPDGTRLAFKRAVGPRWQLWVRDVTSGAEHLVAGESRNVDDQVEWLDDQHVLYQYPSDQGQTLWVVNVDDAASPRRFMNHAWSPAVVRRERR